MGTEVVTQQPEEEAGESQAIEAQQPRERALPQELQLIKTGEGGSLVPANFAEQWRIAQAAVQSGLLPVKKTAEAWLIMQRGAELGFPLLTAVEFLYPVKGRLRLTPDGAKALALRSGLIEDFKEYEEGAFRQGEKGPEFDGDFRAVCWIKRRGVPTPIARSFSVDDAKQAGLWMRRGDRGDSAWVTFWRRMLAARARGFAFQDAFRDVTGGLQVRERYDLAPGESVGGVVVAPPDARDITPIASAPQPAAHRHPVLERLVGPRPEAAVVIVADPPFDAASAQAAILAEAARRVGDDKAAATDLVREVTGGLATVTTREAALEASAKLAAHPIFGDGR